uniref:Uncharacterized protein n=1 Tax=Mandrillus leucophaeus TaxID=9568 RepID=A0A2K6AIU1_MANLE
MAGHISEGAAGTHCTVKQPAEPTMSCKPQAKGPGQRAPQWRQQAGQASGLSFPTINFSRCLILYLQTSYPLCTTQPSVYHRIWAQK